MFFVFSPNFLKKYTYFVRKVYLCIDLNFIINRNMKRIFLNKMFVAAAMVFAASMFVACSSSDDNNTQKEEEKGQTVATSGTLYFYEVVLPEATTWADCGISWTKSGALSKKTTSADATTLDKLTNAKLVAAIKETIKVSEELAAAVDGVQALTDKAVVIVDSLSLTESFSSDVKLNFALKSGFEDKGEEQDITYGMSLCFIDNLGNTQYGKTLCNGNAGVSHLSDYLKMQDEYEERLSVSVTKNASGFLLKTDKK